MRRYTGLRRRHIVAGIEQALGECGGEILSRADPTTAPFEFIVKTPTGAQRELVCYAFSASRYRRIGGPTDRHRFQIICGSRSDRCHRLYFDPRGKKTTLLFGVHLEMDLFVGVDPRCTARRGSHGRLSSGRAILKRPGHNTGTDGNGSDPTRGAR